MKKRDIKFIVIILFLGFSTIVTADIIDGNSSIEPYPRNLVHNSIVVGSDLNQSTSIINHNLIGLSGTSRLMTYTSSSKLVLRNTTLELDGNYTFSHGALEIVGNVTITGSGNSFTFAAASLLINANSSLIIDKGVMFEFASTDSITAFPVFVDKSSQIVLRDATLLVNNPNYGLQFTNGRLVIDGNSIIDNASQASFAALFMGAGYSGSGDSMLQINPGAQLNVKNAGILWRNVLPSSFNLNNGTINVASDSMFLTEVVIDVGSNRFFYDGSRLYSQSTNDVISSVQQPTPFLGTFATDQACFRSLISPDSSLILQFFKDNVDVYKYQLYDPNAQAVRYSAIASATASVSASDGCWSPDGQYIVVGLSSATGALPGVESIIKVQRVVTPTNLVSVSTDFLLGGTGTIVGVAFSPNGKYLACLSTDFISSSTKNILRVLKFDAFNQKFSLLSDATQTDLQPTTGNLSGVTWTPDGNYIAITGGVTSGNSANLQIFKFDGLTTTRVASASPMGVGGYFDRGSWAPNANLFAVGSSTGGANSSYDSTLFVYAFNGTSLVLVDSYAHDAAIKVVKWSPDGKYIALGSDFGSGPNFKIFKYAKTGLSVIAEADGAYVLYVNDISWSPDGSSLYVASESDDLGDTFPTFGVASVSYGSRNPLLTLKDAKIKLKQDTTLSNVNLRLG